MTPMLPAEGDRRLEDLAIDLVDVSGRLAGTLHPFIQQEVGDLVRSMNCYYSNLIEGHNTHPRDIDQALANDYSLAPEKRNKQLEAVAHIAVQRAIDRDEAPAGSPLDASYLRWVHRTFCELLPPALLVVTNPDTGEELQLVPGALRERFVTVGQHLAPEPAALPALLEALAHAYDSARLSKLRRIVAVAAAHHRLAWVHPFLDGNGRVTRLVSHALLRQLGVGSSLWSVSRGLARHVGRYRAALMRADEPRRNDFDGRGNLSGSGLTEFCIFFLETCVDQVKFMTSILEPTELLQRMERFVDDEVAAGRLPKGSLPVLREALLAGEVPRARVASLTGHQERAARSVSSKLLEKGLLKSEGVRAPLRLAFPIDVVGRWFPQLYPMADL
jgi:Fic family protein